MNTVSRDKALELINTSKGKMFSVLFIKKDGTKRYMNCRTGVKKGVTGKGLSFDPKKSGYVNVYDVQAKGHRLVNINTLKLIKINKSEYTVTDDVKVNLSLWSRAISSIKSTIGWN